ncbi:MAG: hypothetical protein PVI00_10535 [Desulfobacterales bacterium]|jgi:ABC-type transporter Mla MlaB component
MANNFRISIHRKSDNISIRLAGDFDGSSADELLNVLQDRLNDIASISIDTSELNKIYPFGRDVFTHHLFKLKQYNCRINLVGKNAEQITPSEMEYFQIDKPHKEHQQKNSRILLKAGKEKYTRRV